MAGAFYRGLEPSKIDWFASRDKIKLMEDLLARWRHWPYKNTTWLIVSLAVFFWLLRFPAVESVLRSVGDWGIAGAFFAGILFVSVFTVAPAAVLLLYIAEGTHPWLVALAAGLGGMIGDYVIFRYLRDQVFSELKPIWQHSHIGQVAQRLFRTPYFSWLIPLLAMAAIASPLPDEVGLGMLGMTKINTPTFLVATFFLDFVGVLAIVLIAQFRI